MSDQTTTDTAPPEQPDGIEDDSYDLPDPARAAERVGDFLSAYGDGLIEVEWSEGYLARFGVEAKPLYARDLESLRKALAAKDTAIAELNAMLKAAIGAAARTYEQARDDSVAGAEESARRWKAEYDRVNDALTATREELAGLKARAFVPPAVWESDIVNLIEDHEQVDPLVVVDAIREWCGDLDRFWTENPTAREVAHLRKRLAERDQRSTASLESRITTTAPAVDGGVEADDAPRIGDRVEYVGEVPVVTGRVVRLGPVAPRAVLIEDDTGRRVWCGVDDIASARPAPTPIEEFFTRFPEVANARVSRCPWCPDDVESTTCVCPSPTEADVCGSVRSPGESGDKPGEFDEGETSYVQYGTPWDEEMRQERRPAPTEEPGEAR